MWRGVGSENQKGSSNGDEQRAGSMNQRAKRSRDQRLEVREDDEYRAGSRVQRKTGSKEWKVGSNDDKYRAGSRGKRSREQIVGGW